MMRRLRAAVANPSDAWYRFRLRRHPDHVFRRYAELARRRGLFDVHLVLSFDCDTPEDAAVVEKLHSRLVEIGARPVYAVPGELLRRGAAVYRDLFAEGAEFLNHGYTQHTFIDPAVGEYRSCFFYDQLSRSHVEDDIRRGQETVQDVLGSAPRGFRTPHFGTFQKRSQLRFLHRVLRKVGCEYSTSTVPRHALRRGPAFRSLGIVEFPVTGGASSPLEVFDTWGYFAAPDREFDERDFLAEGTALARRMGSLGTGIINVYGDPVHVHDNEVFLETVAAWLEVAKPTSYRDLLGVV